MITVTADQLKFMRDAVRRVPAWAGVCVERKDGVWAVVLGDSHAVVPDLEEWTELELFDWLSDRVDILLLAREAEAATAPDGPPLVPIT